MAMKSARRLKIKNISRPRFAFSNSFRQSLSSKDLFVVKFWNKLKEDKLFLLSFIITITAFTVFVLNKVSSVNKEALNDNNKNNIYVETEDGIDTNDLSNTTESDISLKGYVGIYSREVSLDNSLNLSDSCKIESYKIIYNITKDNKIEKYFYSSCIGTIKLWEDGVTYTEDGGVRYITSNNTFFKFSNDNIKEIKDDKTLKYDADFSINGINENVELSDDIKIYFYGENIVFLKNDNLLLLSGKEILFNANEKYVNNGGNLDKRFYKSKSKYQFNFIVFNNKENVVCYDALEENGIFADGELYNIYSIDYDPEKGKFEEPVLLVSRNKMNSCKYYDEDLKKLKN